MVADVEPSSPSGVEAPCFAGFFIVLPDPVPIPNGSTWCSVTEEREPFLDGLALAPFEDAAPIYSEDEAKNFASIRFLQVDDHSVPSLHADSSILMEAAARIIPPERSEKPDLSMEAGRYRTVVEMVTFVASENDWHATATKPDPLTRCITELLNFHRAYRVLTHLPCEELTYKRLHPLVMMTRRRLADDKPVADGVMLLDMRPDRIGSVVDDIGAVEFDRVSAAHNRLQAGDPSAAFCERMVDANYAFTQLGKNAEAVVQAAIGCEVLLDGCLGMCLWEAGESEQEAAEKFSLDITPRVKTALPKALGGNWSLSNGPVGDWYDSVAGLRNRVVHGGYQPNDNEVARCLTAVDTLFKHILDCVHDKAHRYPATAWAFLGVQGYEQRGGVTRRAEYWKAENDIIGSIDQYSQWRRSVNTKVQRRKKSA